MSQNKILKNEEIVVCARVCTHTHTSLMDERYFDVFQNLISDTLKTLHMTHINEAMSPPGDNYNCP